MAQPILLFFIGAIIGAVITAVATAAQWYVARPKLVIEVGSDGPFILAAPHKESPSGVATWLRFRVDNSSLFTARGVRAYLTDVTPDPENKTKQNLPYFKNDALLLWASSAGDGKSTDPISISPNFGRFFDFAFFYGKDDLRIPNEIYYKEQGYVPGKYRFRVVIAGENFYPIEKTILVHFSGAKDTPHVVLLD